jgi:dihydrofolate reductase
MDGSVDWLFSDQDYGYQEFYNSVDTVVMGRKTYEQARRFEQHPFAGKKCFVFSRTRIKSPKKNVEFINNQLPEFIRRIKSESQKDIWLVGGAEIIEIFLNQHSLDSLILSIHPVILGKGIPLFQNLEREVNLKLRESISFNSGLVQLYYNVVNKR